MNNKYKFKHELPKDQSNIYGKVSSPLCLAELLTQLLGINEAQAGKIIYDCCIGVGALSNQIDLNKHVLIGDDKELEYLKQAQQNNPEVILFNHDAFQCLGPPCYEHLVSPEWKAKVDQEIKSRESQLDEAEVQKEYERLMSLNLTDEQIKEMTEKQEALLKQRALECLIKQEAKKKKGTPHVTFSPIPSITLWKELVSSAYLPTNSFEGLNYPPTL